MNIKLLLSRTWFLVVETVYLIIIPLILCFLWPQFIVFRTWVMVGGLLYVGLMMRLVNLRAYDIGLTGKNMRIATRQLLPPTIVCSGAIVIFGFIGLRVGLFPRILEDVIQYGRVFGLFFYILISVPLQEIIFRGFYIRRLEFVSNNELFLKFWSAAIFAAIHIPYSNGYLVGISFLYGVWAAGIFIKYRNLYAIMIAHAFIGGAEIVRQILILGIFF